MKLFFSALALLALMACADTHTLTRSQHAQVAAMLDRQASAYVAVTTDGRYGDTVYFGSGAMTAQSVASAFAPYLSKIITGTKPEDLDQALSSARSGRFRYLLYPQILHWEDRATEWSAQPDRATIKLSLFSTDSGAMIDSAIIEGKSGLATFGGDHPQDLLPKPLGQYAASLFK